MTISLEIVLWITFLILSIFFSGIDMAFVATDKLQFAITRKNKGVYNFMLNSIYGNSREFLATLIIGKVISLVLFVYLLLLFYYCNLDIMLKEKFNMILFVIFPFNIQLIIF
jgi:putative hemolysin